jgi:MarR-like DNA-binding transcriptional regulator SgrR of sgrS sRNA
MFSVFPNTLWVIDGLSTSQPIIERIDLITELTKFGINIMQFPDMFLNKYLFRKCLELLDNDLSEDEKYQLQQKIEQSVAAGVFKDVKEDNNENNDVKEASSGIEDNNNDGK